MCCHHCTELSDNTRHLLGEDTSWLVSRTLSADVIYTLQKLVWQCMGLRVFYYTDKYVYFQYINFVHCLYTAGQTEHFTTRNFSTVQVVFLSFLNLNLNFIKYNKLDSRPWLACLVLAPEIPDLKNIKNISISWFYFLYRQSPGQRK